MNAWIHDHISRERGPSRNGSRTENLGKLEWKGGEIFAMHIQILKSKTDTGQGYRVFEQCEDSGSWDLPKGADDEVA